MALTKEKIEAVVNAVLTNDITTEEGVRALYLGIDMHDVPKPATRTVEAWIAVNEEDSVGAGETRELAMDALRENYGGDECVAVKVTLTLPYPKDAEVTLTVAEPSAPEASATAE